MYEETTRTPVAVEAPRGRRARCSHCLKTIVSKWLQSHNLRLGISFHESTELQPERNEQLVVADLLTFSFYETVYVYVMGFRRRIRNRLSVAKMESAHQIPRNYQPEIRAKEGSCEGNVSPAGSRWCARPSVHHIGESPVLHPSTLT